MYSNIALSAFETLTTLGLPLTLERGALYGRGFADLGYELFSCVGPRKLVSLFSGKVTEVAESELARLFPILSPDQLTDELLHRGGSISSIVFDDNRCWKLELSYRGRAHSYSDSRLDMVLVAALREVLTGQDQDQGSD